MSLFNLIGPLTLLGGLALMPIQMPGDDLQSCSAARHVAVMPAPELTSAPADKGTVPADMVGSWSWTTISGVNYRNTTTGQLSAPSGMSAKFTFLSDGRYNSFFYIRQQTYSLVTESTTTAEGNVTFGNDGTFVVRPTRGHYTGHTGSKPLDRDMTEKERAPATYYWEWRTENGKHVLYIGPSKTSLSLFKRD